MIITIHYLLSQHGSVFLSLFCEFLLWIWLFVWGVKLALSCCDGWFGVGVILCVYLLSCLLQNPVVLIIIVMSSLVHKVFENLSHVVVIWSFFEFQVTTVVQVRVEFVGQPSRERLNCSANFFVFNTIVLIIFVFTL